MHFSTLACCGVAVEARGPMLPGPVAAAPGPAAAAAEEKPRHSAASSEMRAVLAEGVSANHGLGGGRIGLLRAPPMTLAWPQKQQQQRTMQTRFRGCATRATVCIIR